MRSASTGARSTSDGCTRRSYTTTSARASSSAPRTVSSPGSPGPAPTRYTVMCLLSPDQLVVEHEATALLVDETAGRLDADRDRIVAFDARPQRDPSVERAQQHLEPQRAVVGGLGQRTAGEVAAAAELAEVGAFGGDGGAQPGVVDAGEELAGPVVVCAAFGRQRALRDLREHHRGIHAL